MSEVIEEHKFSDLIGNWQWGSAYDIHTISSQHYTDESGRDRWNNTRSEMGELVYKLKYKSDKSVTKRIVSLLLKGYTGLGGVDAIIPAPPSKQRSFQPVYEICQELGSLVNVPVLYSVLLKKSESQELKGIEDVGERSRILKSSMYIHSKNNLAGKSVLLIDDLYRSGATLRVATELLYSIRVKNVYVLTMTRTRSKK